MKPGSNVYTPRSRVMLAMFSTSGPSVPLLISAVVFLPVARLVSSNFFSAMSGSTAFCRRKSAAQTYTTPPLQSRSAPMG